MAEGELEARRAEIGAQLEALRWLRRWPISFASR